MGELQYAQTSGATRIFFYEQIFVINGKKTILQFLPELYVKAVDKYKTNIADIETIIVTPDENL